MLSILPYNLPLSSQILAEVLILRYNIHMPQEPKKRHSRQRQGKRRAHIHLQVAQAITCANCGATTLAHTVCKACGYYKGKKVVTRKRK